MFVSIILVCKPGFYNNTSHCTSKCGHCKDNTTCDNESGQCPDGCEQHFKDPFCQGSLKYRCKCLNNVLSLSTDTVVGTKRTQEYMFLRSWPFYLYSLYENTNKSIEKGN